MTMVFGIPIQAFLGQLLIGLINGSFYALLSLGLAVIFGLLRVINFAHGALYMLGAFVAYLLLAELGIPYWPALIIAPLIVAAFGALIERTMLSRLYDLDHLYGLLFTFSLAQEQNVSEDIMQARMAIECQAIRLACSAAEPPRISSSRRTRPAPPMT